MNREDIIRMAREAGWDAHHAEFGTRIQNFADLVAKHTLANIDPSSFMTWQEGYEAGKQTEREACAKVCEPSEEHRREASWGYLGGEEGVTLLDAKAADIRARGQA